MTENVTADMTSEVYGFKILSDIFFPELQQTGAIAETADRVLIQQGAVPEPACNDLNDVRSYVYGDMESLVLNFPNILRMEIKNGREIIYDRYPDVDDDEIRLYILGSGLGAILMQRGYVVIHANALVSEEHDGAILCIGDSGAGKSTTAIAMMQRGLKILADDVCPLDSEGVALPGMARAKLWQETAQQLGIDVSQLSRVRRSDAKFNLPLGPAHCSTKQTVGSFYWLVPEDVEQVSLSQIHGTEKFTVLRNNVYRPEYLHPLGLEEGYLRRLAHIASKTQLFRVSRPNKGFEIDDLLDTILSNEKLRQEKYAPRAAFENLGKAGK